MSKATAPARRDSLRDYAAQFGDPMPEFDPLYQAFISPAIRAAMTSLPSQLDYNKLTETGFGLRFFCVVNEGQPDIFCTRYDNSNIVILNFNLINHLYNLARQLFCMRDVFSTIGIAASERRSRTTYNRYNEIFDIKLNIYDTDTDCPYQPVSPNKQPRCEIRQDGFLILFWFMLEHLILHELSHIVQGHLAVGEADPWRGLEDSSEQRIINRSSTFEILADTLSVHWFAIADIARLRRSYGRNLDALTPAQRRALRLAAPALSYWAFSSYSVEFCMDVRKHKMAIIGHAPEPETGYLTRNYRIGFTEELALRALAPCGLSVRLSAAAVTTARAWQHEFRDRLQFYSPSSLYNKIIHQLIRTEFLESKESIESLMQQTRPLNFLGEHWQRTQYSLLIDWISHSHGEGAHPG